MAFISRVGNLLKQNASKHVRCDPPVLGPFLYQAIRCMSSKLFVGGLSYATDDISLKDAFSSYGEIIEARVIMDRETGRSRGFGFVSFTSRDEASSAMQDMDGKDLHGRRIRVNYAVEKSRGGFPGFQGGTGFRDGGSYGSGGYGGGGGTAGGYNYASSQGGGNYDAGTGGYDGGSSYRDSARPADPVNRQGGGYGGSAGGGDIFSSAGFGADGGFTSKVHDEPASDSSGGILDQDESNEPSFADQPGDNDVPREGMKGEHEPDDDLANAKN